MAKGTELDSVSTVLWLQQADALNTFTRMWYHVFLWALFSSIFVHTVSANSCKLQKISFSRYLCSFHTNFIWSYLLLYKLIINIKDLVILLINKSKYL